MALQTITLEDQGKLPQRWKAKNVVLVRLKANKVLNYQKPKNWKKVRRKMRMKQKRVFNKLGVTTYGDYLRTQHWELIKRKLRKERKVCEICSLAIKLHVHHGTYERIGQEREEDLFLLCEGCHDKVHEYHNKDRAITLLEATKEYIRKNKK